MSIAAWTAASALVRRRPAGRHDARLPVAVRVPAFALLAGFGALAWAQMVGPAAWGAMAAALGATLAGAVVLVALGRSRVGAGWRAAVTLAVAAVLLLVAFSAAGVPADLAGPRAWDDLAAGIAQGLGAVPNVRVPYSGVDEWTRIVIVLGGGLLVGVGALLAFAPRRGGALGFPAAAAMMLGTLYLVPVMQREGEHPFLGGATFALLLALFLWLERVERGAARFAAVVVAVAVLGALVLAPRIDGSAPLLDYEGLAQSLTSASTRYDWNHSYGPLNWPRDGTEMLRIRARTRDYWKATNLPVFDGGRWLGLGNVPGTRLNGGLFDPRWRQELRVTVRGLRSEQFVTAGTTISISASSRTPVQNEPGQFTTLERPLRPGNSYRAVVYAPRPSAIQMRAANALVPPFDETLSAVVLPRSRGRDPVVALVPPWGVAEPSPRTVAAIESSPYARAWTLARRLRARSATPYDFMRAVERHLAGGYLYSEKPRASALPLMEFLFGERLGYCQHFSGAMALLLRLGGVPARVAAGFSPGAYDSERREYVVRDLDAHSWVEVFFPGIGWVTRDPTPATSPARSQLADRARAADSAQPEPAPADATGTPVPRADSAPAITPGGGAESERSPRLAIALGAAIAGALAALAVLLAVVRRRRRRTDAAAGELADGPLGELLRALRRSGRSPSPQTTLEALAARWRGTAAEGYVRALVAARYGYGGAHPTPAQRAALRRELAAGGGLRGRLRAWWALPPRAPRRPFAVRRRRRLAAR